MNAEVISQIVAETVESFSMITGGEEKEMLRTMGFILTICRAGVGYVTG